MKLVKRLTDNYKKNPESNIGKLLSIIDYELSRLEETFKTIDSYRAIDNATGATLDNIGKNVLQDRGGMDDITYRLFLKTKIRANLSGGQISTINQILSVVMEDNFLYLREIWDNALYSNEPSAIEITYINLFDNIRDKYIFAETDPWFFDGKYALDGSKSFDGGLLYSYEDLEPKIIEAIQKTKEIINLIKAAGVRVYWREPVAIETLINIANDVTISLQKPTETPVVIVNDAEISNHYDVYNGSTFLMDGLFYFDGSMSLDGNRPFTVNDVIITEVSA